MNYQKIHDKLIESAKSRILSANTYTERHHIIPRCMGGQDTEDNLVRLLAKEHYLIHWMLVRIYPDNTKLVFAWNQMTWNLDGVRYTSKTFHLARAAMAKVMSERVVSVETKALISKNHAAKNGRIPWNKGKKATPEQVEKNRLSHLGHAVSEEIRIKIKNTCKLRGINKGRKRPDVAQRLKGNKLPLETIAKMKETKRLNRLKRILNGNY